MQFELISKMAFQAIGGLGIFLLGMKYLSDGIQSFAGNQLRRLISAVTDNRFIALTVGVAFTCLVQSSSITTVMIVGLVNSGVMTLLQAIGVIMGANIGTTITGWILVLKIGKYGLPILGMASFFFLFSKNERVRFYAMAVMGVGMVFFGLELMKNGFKPIRSVPEFVEWFAMFNADTYFGIVKLALMGCLLTFVVQSSSATLAITMGLASTGVINFESAAALVLGENIGTTITAYLASLGATINAKRAAYAHIIFNVIGVIWIITVFPAYILLVKGFLGVKPELMEIVNGVETYPYIILGIATVHSGFNIANAILFIPFIGYMEKLLLKLAPGKVVEGELPLTRLESAILETPVIAIDHSYAEIMKMGNTVEKMMVDLKNAIGGNKVDHDAAERLFQDEKDLDIIQNEVSIFLTDLLALGLPLEVTEEGRRQIRMADEYESISDYIEKILKLYLRLKDDNLKLPDEEKKGIFDLHEDVFAYLKFVNKGCVEKNGEIIREAHDRSAAITRKVRRVRTRHIERLSDARKEPLITMIFADMINNYRRVKDHALNIAETVAGEK